MRTAVATVIGLIVCAFGESALASRQQSNVPTSGGVVLVESFGKCPKVTCPTVLILSGSKGFGTLVYDEIGRKFRAAGLNAYLVHVLSPNDLDAIAMSSGARARIAYYEQRMTVWTSAVRDVVSYLDAQPGNSGKIGILGISLGAQIASAASAGQSNIDALALVDGGFPSDYSYPVRSLPSLLLVWGSADKTFPLSIGRELQRKAQQLGTPVTLDVYDGGTHDFFLRSGTKSAGAAHRSVAEFLRTELSR